MRRGIRADGAGGIREASGRIQKAFRKVKRGAKGIAMGKRLGIIGGLGPLATAYYYELITKMTQVSRDQDHIEILIHSVPQIPDRTGFIVGESKENPLPLLLETGRGLVSQGAECIAIPCITAHYFHQELVEEISVPIIHLVEETAEYIH